MTKDLTKNKDVIGKVYQEFSKQRSDYYKSKFPRMKETEIISKTIADWEAMGNSDRNELAKSYTERKFIKEKSSSSPSGSKGQQRTRKIKTPV
jgi:hypothetical protein